MIRLLYLLLFIFYLLFLVFSVGYFIKVIYNDYRKEQPFGYGTNKALSFIILLCITVGQYSIPSIIIRLFVFLGLELVFLLAFRIIEIHNQKNHSGDLFFFFQEEVKKAQICIYIGIGFILLALLFVCFVE